MTHPKALILILLVLAVGLLAACDTTDNDIGANAGRAAAHEAATTETAAPVPQTAIPSADEVGDLPDGQVLDVLRTEAPYFDSVPDAQIVELADSICVALDSGATVSTVLTTSITSGVPGGPAGSMIAAAVYGWCPEYVADLSAFVNS